MSSAPSHSPTPARLRLALACDFSQVRRTAEAARQFLLEQGCPEEERIDCEMALVEACNNAIEYALPAAREEAVAVEIICLPDWVELRITDHTPGFEWPREFKLPDAGSERGRGLYLIHSLMHEATYLRSASRNTLLLRKRRAASARA